MKNIQNKLFVLLFIAFSFLHLGSSQENLTDELNYDVYVNYPPLSITKEKLKEAQTLVDLNENYKPSWIKEYISVEVRTSNNGKILQTMSENMTLSQEQKDIMNMADLGTDISVKVLYIPDNTLTHNDIKEIKFTFTVDPENEAVYPGGQQQLKQYLKENAIDKIPDGIFDKYQLAAVKFTIDEEGHVINPSVFWTSEDEKTDELLLHAIYNMPDWKPAEYSNGIKVKQEFVLTVGDMESCVVNTLNIRQD